MNRVVSLLKSRRLWGLLGTAAVLYFLTFVVLGKTKMNWLMPDTNQLAHRIMVDWQDLPFFTSKTEVSSDGKYIYYTVPTKQFTPQQLMQMGMTNAVAKPVAPK